MYEILKKAMGIAEQIGEIRAVNMTEKDKIWGDRVIIEGIKADGSVFAVEVSIKEHTDDRN